MNLTTRPEVITRPETHFLYLEKEGHIRDIAMPAWTEMFPLIEGKFESTEIKEYLGMTQLLEESPDKEAVAYDAGIALSTKPKSIPKGMLDREVPAGKYARFVLTGPYKEINSAFGEVFKILESSHFKIRSAECVENYLNDPSHTPEPELKTEILVPIQ